MNNIITTKDGSHSMISEKFGVTYHSIHGAIQETQHVFIQAGLHHQLQEKSHLSILEIGWGTGLNTYMTLLESILRKVEVNYTAIEAYPITLVQAKELNYHELLGQENADAFLDLHRVAWEEKHLLTPHFSFTKHQMLFEDIDFKEEFDVIYFDAFAPTAQAHLWEVPFLTQVYSSLEQGGILVTYCAKGSFKRALKAVGFQVESIPGPPRKREMTRARK